MEEQNYKHKDKFASSLELMQTCATIKQNVQRGIEY